MKTGRAILGVRPVGYVGGVAEGGIRVLLEQRQDLLRIGIGDRQRLNAQLLLDLERLEADEFLAAWASFDAQTDLG